MSRDQDQRRPANQDPSRRSRAGPPPPDLAPEEAARLRRAQRRVFGSLGILLALLGLAAWVRWCAPAPPERPASAARPA